MANLVPQPPERTDMDFSYDVESTCSDDQPYIVGLRITGVGSQCTTELRMTRAEVKELRDLLTEAFDEIDNYFQDLETEGEEASQ